MITNTSGNHWTGCGDAPSTNEDPPSDPADCKACGDSGRDWDGRICQECCGPRDRVKDDGNAYDRAGDR